jgi:integrase
MAFHSNIWYAFANISWTEAMQKKINEKLAQNTKPPEKGSVFVRNLEFIGFGLRVTASGVRTFYLRYTIHGRERCCSIGRYPIWSAAAARTEAARLRRMVDVGKDPMAERSALREEPRFSDLTERYIREHLPRKRPGSQKNDISLLERHLLPKFRDRRLGELTHADFEKLHTAVSIGAPIAANRVLALASKMFNLARRWGWIDQNPVALVERNRELARDRYLTMEEVSRLIEVLRGWSDRASARAILLLLLTGSRRGEVLSARWEHFDLSSGVWQKPAAITKQGRNHRVPLSNAALDLLREMANERKEGFLFPGPGERCHLIELKRQWRAIREAADLQDLRLHDLRHCFASLLASQGCSLPVIGALLGHTTPQTTARYTHLLDAPLRTATNLVGNRLVAPVQCKNSKL